MTRHTLFNILLFLLNIALYFVIPGIQSQALLIISMSLNAVISLYLIALPIISTFSENMDNNYILCGIRFFKVKKKIHYKGLKHVFLVYKDDKVYLLHDRLFCLNRISKFNYTSDKIDDYFKEKIQTELNEHFKDKFKPSNRKCFEKNIKNWSGCLTTEDERDKKITDIL